MSQFHLPELGVVSAAFRNHHPLCSGARHAKGRTRTRGQAALLPPNLAPFQIPFGDWFFCALVVRPPDKLAPDCKHLRNLYPADEKEGVAIRTGYRPLPPPPMPLRTHPSWRRRTEQKNSADADTKLPSQYGKLFQLNRGIQIEFRESPPPPHFASSQGRLAEDKDFWENDSFSISKTL